MVLAVAATSAPVLAVTSSPTIRRVVYSFTWGTTNDTEVHTSGLPDSASGSGGSGGMGAVPPSNFGSASGISSYGGGTNDRGTIAVDFVRQQPDGGYVVSISETALERRSAPEATCVVYGDLTVVCDPNKKITEEELDALAVARLELRRSDSLDAKQPLAARRKAARVNPTTSDFTIAKNANGIMTIDEAHGRKRRRIAARRGRNYRNDRLRFQPHDPDVDRRELDHAQRTRRAISNGKNADRPAAAIGFFRQTLGSEETTP